MVFHPLTHQSPLMIRPSVSIRTHLLAYVALVLYCKALLKFIALLQCNDVVSFLELKLANAAKTWSCKALEFGAAPGPFVFVAQYPRYPMALKIELILTVTGKLFHYKCHNLFFAIPWTYTLCCATANDARERVCGHILEVCVYLGWFQTYRMNFTYPGPVPECPSLLRLFYTIFWLTGIIYRVVNILIHGVHVDLTWRRGMLGRCEERREENVKLSSAVAEPFIKVHHWQ